MIKNISNIVFGVLVFFFEVLFFGQVFAAPPPPTGLVCNPRSSTNANVDCSWRQQGSSWSYTLVNWGGYTSQSTFEGSSRTFSAPECGRSYVFSVNACGYGGSDCSSPVSVSGVTCGGGGSSPCSASCNIWSACQPGNYKYCTSVSTSPANCSGGTTTVANQSCTYTPTCAYSCNYSACQPGNVRYKGCWQNNAPCTGGSDPSGWVYDCTYIPPTPTCSYSCNYSACQPGNVRYKGCWQNNAPCTGGSDPSGWVYDCTYTPACAYSCNYSACQSGNVRYKGCWQNNAPCTGGSDPSGWVYDCTYIPPTPTCAYSCNYSACQPGNMRYKGCWQNNAPCTGGSDPSGWVYDCTYTPALDSVIVSSTIPTSMSVGESRSVSVTVKNIGTTTWTEANAFRLGGVGDGALDSGKFGLSRFNMSAGASVPTNGQYTFTFTMTAPQTAGTYNPQYRMLQESVAWFGGIQSTVITVNSLTCTSCGTWTTCSNGSQSCVTKLPAGCVGGNIPATRACGTTGVCNNTGANLCNYGTVVNKYNLGNVYTWNCASLDGGATSTLCGYTTPTCTSCSWSICSNGSQSCVTKLPAGCVGGNLPATRACGTTGVCNNTGANLCSYGTVVNKYNLGNVYTWNCASLDGGATSSLCGYTAPINGLCGVADKKTTLTAPTGTSLCSKGTASEVKLNGNKFEWRCDGIAGGEFVTCSAPRGIPVWRE